MATNSNISQGLKEYWASGKAAARRAKDKVTKDFPGNAGSKIGGAAEAIKGRVSGATVGAKAGSAVAGLQNATYKRGSSSAAKLMNKASKAVSGAKIGYKTGAVAAAVSPVGEIRGRMKANEAMKTVKAGKADFENTLTNAKKKASAGVTKVTKAAKAQKDDVIRKIDKFRAKRDASKKTLSA